MGKIPNTFAIARLNAVKKWPYLSKIIYAMVLVVTDQVRLVQVDKWWRLYLNLSDFSELTKDEQVSEVLRAALICMRQHYKRFEKHVQNPTEKDITCWTLGCECEINDDLVNENFPFHVDPVVPAAFNLREGLIAECYYKEILEKCDSVPSPQQNGSAIHGIPQPWEQAPPSQTSPASGENQGTENESLGCSEQDQKELIQDAVEAIANNSRGTLPGFLQRWAKAQTDPQVNYAQYIRTKIRNAIEHVYGSGDYTYRRQSRRPLSAGPGCILPGTIAPRPIVTVIIDTSGSVSEQELSLFLSEVAGVIRSLPRRDGVKVICADADIQSVQKVANVESINLVGGGGTDMAIAIEEAAKETPKPHLIVVLSDGETPWPKTPVRSKVIAVLSRKSTYFKAPSWIETVYLNA